MEFKRGEQKFALDSLHMMAGPEKNVAGHARDNVLHTITILGQIL